MTINICQKVTVLCTVYNGEKYFDRAIPSILNQTYKNFDFLIIDDGSDDNTLSLLKELEKQDNRIKVINVGRLGRIKALNYGIEQATTELIAIQDFDDISYPERLAKQVEFMDKYPDVAWCAGFSILVNEFRGTRQIRQLPTKHKQIIKAMAHSIPWEHTLIMLKRSVILSVGGYVESKGVEDFLLGLNVAKNGNKLANISEILGEHIEHKDSFWNSNFKYIDRQKAIRKVQIKVIKELNLPYWTYIYPIGRTFYSLLPNNLKSLIRYIIGEKRIKI